ncbi:MAG: flagellar biosynthesis protein FlhF [Spirochaetaceae bacterium]|jgi:flagellar biosynthesis protein FlhF|nr:flagellar biosynthesis protein FlhF [Spirochaetaceae bacterium]
MDYFTEQAPSYAQCLEKIRSKYGDSAKVMIKKTVPVKGGFLNLFSREWVEMTGIVSSSQAKYNFTAQTAPRKPMDLNSAELDEEKKKLIAAAGKSDPTLQMLLSEMRTIKEKIDSVSVSAGSGPVPSSQDHPTLTRIENLLNQNDFTPRYRAGIMDRVRREFSLEALEDFKAVEEKAVEWIGESILIYKEDQYQARPRIVVLVGPTGVGKTTTIAKLAAAYMLGEIGKRPLSVRMITIDNFRIGAEQQIERYGQIMGIPVESAENYRELKEVIAFNSENVDLILIDTIGKSPRSSVELAEMKELLDACGSRAEFHLALPATTKSSDLTEILKQYEPFGYRSVIITKMDETIRLGNVISALSDKGKCVSYITEGQQVPKDIQKAEVMRFLVNLEGFTVDRMKFESVFPGDESELIRWRQ